MKILLAVSGGIDSMYLANRAPELFPGALFCVAHCNFTLRGEDSEEDERFVREWCRNRGLECFVRRFDTESYAAAHKLSIETAARELRYSWFAELCEGDGGCDAVAVAHNACDNAETLMLNLLRGTGTRGIRGMSAVSTVPCAGKEVPLLRPLLGTTRDEITSWMTSRGLSWREDRTNADIVYKRNAIRNRVFPVFKEINPSFIQTFGADMKRFRQVDDIAEDYYRQALCEDVAVFVGEEGLPDIDLKKLLSLKHWEYVLWRLLERIPLNQETFGKLVDLLRRSATAPSGSVTLGGKTFEASGDILLTIRRRHLIAARVKPQK